MKVDIEGFKALEKSLGELPKTVGKGVARRAVAKAGEKMADRQRAKAPVADGTLRDSIGSKVQSKQLDGLAEYGEVLRSGGSRRDARSALRGARREARDSGSSKGNRVSVTVGAAAPHAHLVEFGTKPRRQKTTGKSTGVMPANPFIRPAFDEGVQSAIVDIAAGLETEIFAASARLARKAARR